VGETLGLGAEGHAPPARRAAKVARG